MTRRPKPYRAPDGADWRDPEMPVLVHMADVGGLEPFPPAEVQAANKVWHENNPEPSWRHDPTYNLRRKK